jgi:hypothetical protein
VAADSVLAMALVPGLVLPSPTATVWGLALEPLKGWGDSAVARAFDVDRFSVYRWRRGQWPANEQSVAEALRRLLRRPGPLPRRKEPGGGKGPRAKQPQPVADQVEAS